MEDNLYPSSGQYLPTEPVEQALAHKKESDQVQAVAPILKELIERLEDRIAFYESLSSIPADVSTDPEKFMHTVTANRLTRDNLLVEKTTLEDLIRTYTK